MFSIACRHCGAPNSAEDKAAAALVVCFKCGKLVTQEDEPAPKPAAKSPAPPKRAVTPDVETTTVTKQYPSRDVIGNATRTVAWVVCGLATLGVCLLYFVRSAFAESVLQQASIAASSSFLVIALYVLTRALDKIFRG